MILTKKSYPLTIGQEIILFQQQRIALDKSISNISIVMHFEKVIDDVLMLQAISNALYRNHSVSIQLREIAEGTYEQYFSNKTPEPIEVVDMREASQEELENYLKDQAKTEFPNGTFDVPLYRVKYILKPNGLSALYLVICHIIFDVYSMMFLANDAFKLYHCLKEGKPFPKNLPSPIPCFEKELDYLNTPEFQRDKKFWDELNTTEPYYTNFHGEGGMGYIPGKRAGLVAFGGEKIRSNNWLGRIPKELVQKVENFAKEHQVSVQSIYLLMIRNILSKANDYVEDVSIMNSFGRRATKMEKESGGTRASGIRLRMTFNNEVNVVDAAKEILKTQLKCFKHGDLPYPFIAQSSVEQFNLAPGEGYASVIFAFQPYMLETTDDLEYHLQYVNNEQSAVACYLILLNADKSGDITAIYDYNLTFYPTSEKIEQFHQDMLKMLYYLVDHPEASVMELMAKVDE